MRDAEGALVQYASAVEKLKLYWRPGRVLDVREFSPSILSLVLLMICHYHDGLDADTLLHVPPPADAWKIHLFLSMFKPHFCHENGKMSIVRPPLTTNVQIILQISLKFIFLQFGKK